jgi:hypothetical protein
MSDLNGGDQPRALAAILAERAGGAAVPCLVDSLVAEYGYGEDRAKRLALYRRLETLCETHGEVALRCIAEARAQAKSARRPDRLFCKAVCAKLAEALGGV